MDRSTHKILWKVNNMWFLQVVALLIVVGAVFYLGMLQGEAQYKESIRRHRDFHRMGGMSNENKYWR
ncbi:hypothetical protein [Leuconostoc mesenteroides]|uniref:hypothetical protein n=1 Tax=Leuconostoc mesenteroides TaxID=1245 RepID=UPI0011C0569E|nr:hypothetical protein [Leuconostoc mesenteroides]KAA8366315.1 hypothetical protein FE417_09420 [Leuconostoc mesenteroides]MCM6836129.1 hypothetical protein [Leuconostoc mesenteroides]